MDGRRRIFRFIDWVAASVALAVTVILPAGFFAVSYQYQQGQLQTALGAKAVLVNQYINQQPELWRFEERRLVFLLRQDGDGEYVGRVMDQGGAVLAQGGKPPAWPLMSVQAPLYDAGMAAGTLEMARSLRPLALQTLFVALGGMALGLVVFFPLRLVPRRALSLALDELAREREQLSLLNATLEQRVREEVAKNREKDLLLVQQSRLAAMGEMIGNIAHQWRQPINALGLMLANIEDAHAHGELDAAFLKDTVAAGQRIIQRMSSTIDDFRYFFRANKERAPFSLNRALAEVKGILGASLASQFIRLEEEADGEVTALGYAGEFSRVLLNLVSNAKEAIAARQGAEPGCIRIRLAREDGMAVVRVTDNGGGIDDAFMGKIFDPYFTTKPQGTGIGLYMAKMIIEGNMEGRLTLRNVEGGVEATVAVPAA
jgi:signal transduction histidine kinase